MGTLINNALAMKVIAHRGASGEFPENTLLAFEQAILQQADAIELDVQFHQASQQYLVLHDQYITTPCGLKKPIQRCSIDELFKHQLADNQSLIALSEALTCIAGRVPVNVEVKSATGNDVAIENELKALKKVINQYQADFNTALDDIIISSFNHQLLAQSFISMPQCQHGALIAHVPTKLENLIEEIAVNTLNVDINAVNKELVQTAHNLGIAINVYTVDQDYDIERCIEYGVDAIFTNWPARSRKRIIALKEPNHNPLI